MNEREFQKWFDHFAAAFPAVQDFVRKSDLTGEATLKLWCGVLAKRDLADDLAVTNELFEGGRPIPWLDRGFHDWSSVPRHVSRLCAERHPVEPEWKQHTVRRNGPPGIISHGLFFDRCARQPPHFVSTRSPAQADPPG